MTYEEALKKVDALSNELDENGYTSILILEANGCRNKKAMRVTHPPEKPFFIDQLISEAFCQITMGTETSLDAPNNSKPKD